MSTDTQITALEARATAAEKSLKELQSHQHSSNAVVAAKLKELMALMDEDRKEAEEIRAHRDELKEENGKLKAQVGKLSYRVNHLLKTIKEIEDGKAASH